MELLPDSLIFLGDGCELLGYPAELMGDSDELLDELRQEGDGGGFGGNGDSHCFGVDIWEVLGVEAQGTPGLGQVFCHEG